MPLADGAMRETLGLLREFCGHELGCCEWVVGVAV